MSPDSPFIVVAGNIATGKTALAAALADALGARLMPEEVARNPFFERFYADPGRWAFQSQLAFAIDSLERHVSALGGGAVIQDRCVQETVEVFGALLHAQGRISAEDLELLDGLRSCASGLSRQPTLLVFLRASPEELLRRIEARGRRPELGLTLEYLRELDELYERFVGAWAASPVIAVDTEARDLRREEDFARLLGEIGKAQGAPSEGIESK